MNIEEPGRIPIKVLSIALLLAFGIFMPLLVIPPIEDQVSRELAISHSQTALLYTLPVAILALVAIPAGFLADTIGLKKSIGTGALILMVGSVLRSISSEYSVIVVFTLMYGLGLGLCFPNIPKLARHCSTRERSHFTVSLFTMGILASGAISLLIIGPVIYPITNSLRGVFIFSSIPIFIAVCLWWPLITDPPYQTSGVASIGADWASLRKVIARRDLWLVCLLFLLHNIVLFTLAGWLPDYLISLGASVGQAGLITSVMFWVGLPSVILLSRLSAKLGRRKPFLWGPTILLVFAIYSLLPVNIQLSWVVVPFLGIATTIRFSTILSLPVEMVDPAQSGSASGMVMSIGYIGALIGPLVGGILLDKLGDYKWIFLSLVIVSVITVIEVLFIPETGILQPSPDKNRGNTRG